MRCRKEVYDSGLPAEAAIERVVFLKPHSQTWSKDSLLSDSPTQSTAPRIQRGHHGGTIEFPLGLSGNRRLGQRKVLLHPGGGGPQGQGQGGVREGRPRGSTEGLISELGQLTGSPSCRGCFGAGSRGSVHGDGVAQPPLRRWA